jgi:uncharacterized protein YfiM (DUF2279 family)
MVPVARRVKIWRLAIGFLLSCFIVALFATSALAQEATIVGTVTDPSGLLVANAAIKITNTDTGIVTSLTTNADGQYVAPDLHIGHYTVRVEAAGFKVGEEKGIVLQVGDRTRVDFKLQVGNAKETITVEANAVTVQTETGEVSGVVTGQQITELATNGRGIFNLEALQPGASSIQSDFSVPVSSAGDFNVSFNGQRVVHNLWLVDGGEAADRGGGGGSIVLPSVDAIAEFRTMTSNYSAEYGLSSAGSVSMVIKSGTSKFHGTAFYFGRNEDLDARYYFFPAPSPVTEFRLHDFGFNVGGPVALHESGSHKTFFFYNMEWRRYVHGGTFNNTMPLGSLYPDAQGAGTGVVLPGTIADGSTLSVVAPTNIASLDTNCSAAVQATLIAGQPFPSNTIPDCAINSNATALLGAGIFLKPNSGWQYKGGANTHVWGKEEIARIDHQFSDKFSIFGHWISDQSIQSYGTVLWSGDNSPAVGNTYGNPSYSFVVHATNQIHPNLLNEIAFNYDGNRIHILPTGVYSAPSGFTFNKIFSGTNVDNRIPDIQLGGSTGSHYQVNWLPWNNSADDYQVRDDLSLVKGAHQLKMGFGWAIYKKVQDYFAETQGGYNFNGTATTPAGCVAVPHTTACGLDFADFVLGDASNYNENAYKGTGHWNAISPDAYFQDNWRATHRLTLNLGLRWDGIPHTYEANNSQTDFYPSQYSRSELPLWPTVGGVVNYAQICGGSPLPNGCAAASPGLGPSPVASLQGYQFYLNGMGGGQHWRPKGLANAAWWSFGPRFGFAYDLTGNGKTVIRGGYGVMYERIQGNDMYNGATNPPFGYALGTTDVLLSNPGTNYITGTKITIPIVPAGVTGVNLYYPAPRVSQFSAGVQQAIGSKAVFSMSYVGAQDRDLSYWQEINLPPSGDLAALQAGTNPTPFNGDVPYQGYGSIKQAFNGGNSHYNSLQGELHGQVTRDLTLQAAYTFSKAVDPTTGNGGNGWDLNYVSNPYQSWQWDLGPSVLDRRQIAFVNFVYDIPFLKNSSNHFLKTVVGGWELSGIVTMESGAPYNLSVSGGNVGSIFPGGDVAARPNLIGPISYPKTKVYCSGTSGAICGIQWTNPGAFSAPQPGQFGTLGFDGLRGPGRDNWNLSLFKKFVISESRGSEFQFRAESFNTWNHTQFGGSGQNGNFSTGVTSSNFGEVTGTYDPRVLQLGAKLIF